MQDDRVSKTPLWRQPVMWASATAALAVVGGVGWMIYSTEELDEKLDRQAAVADDRGRLAQLQQAYIESAAEDARRREPQGGGNSSPLPGEADEASSAALPSDAEAKKSAAPSGAEPAGRAEPDSSPEPPAPAAVPIQQPPSQPAEPAVKAPAAVSPPTNAPRKAQPQTAEAAATEPPRAEPAAPRPPGWMKVNENGEPYEVTLADGTVLKLDTYGDDYDGYDYRPPMRDDQGKILVDYKRMGWDGLEGGAIQLDLKHKKMYWGDTPGGDHPTSIRCANLDGSRIQTVVDRNPNKPRDFALDVEGGKIYWVNGGRANGEGRSIQCANLDGSNVKMIIPTIGSPVGIAVDSAARMLYYVDGDNIIRCELDGSAEERLLVTRRPETLLLDSASQTIYWTTDDEKIRRAGYDGQGVEEAVNVGASHGHIRHVAMGGSAGKIYWTNESYRHVCRANLDGSQIETLVIGIVTPTGLAVDFERQHLYWMESFADEQGVGNVRIRRAKLPAALSPVRKSAPPLVTRFEPVTIAVGDEVALIGKHLGKATAVTFVDDASGTNIKARFRSISDGKLSVRVPQMSKECRNPCVVVVGPGGATVTLPRSARVVARQAIDRFHPSEQFTYVAPKGAEVKMERGLVYAQRGGDAFSGTHGRNTFFIQNGARGFAGNHPNNVIYFEPFALLSSTDKSGPTDLFVPCPAVRPSFLEFLPEYK